ncbi:MAG: hypothetical protein AB1646_11945 [Thermodesulfobacteriota bacterium]
MALEHGGFTVWDHGKELFMNPAVYWTKLGLCPTLDTLSPRELTLWAKRHPDQERSGLQRQDDQDSDGEEEFEDDQDETTEDQVFEDDSDEEWEDEPDDEELDDEYEGTDEDMSDEPDDSDVDEEDEDL